MNAIRWVWWASALAVTFSLAACRSSVPPAYLHTPTPDSTADLFLQNAHAGLSLAERLTAQASANQAVQAAVERATALAAQLTATRAAPTLWAAHTHEALSVRATSDELQRQNDRATATAHAAHAQDTATAARALTAEAHAFTATADTTTATARAQATSTALAYAQATQTAIPMHTATAREARNREWTNTLHVWTPWLVGCLALGVALLMVPRALSLLQAVELRLRTYRKPNGELTVLKDAGDCLDVLDTGLLVHPVTRAARHRFSAGGGAAEAEQLQVMHSNRLATLTALLARWDTPPAHPALPAAAPAPASAPAPAPAEAPLPFTLIHAPTDTPLLDDPTQQALEADWRVVEAA